MLKPTLVYLFDGAETEAIKIWPEIGQVVEIDARAEAETYDGIPVWGHENTVVSIPEGSEPALKLVLAEVYGHDTWTVSVRRRTGLHVSWWARLGELATRDVILSDHTRHDVVEAIALRKFHDGLRALEDSAELVRGEGIDPSPEAMRTEKALSRAIEALRATGFRAPKNR